MYHLIEHIKILDSAHRTYSCVSYNYGKDYRLFLINTINRLIIVMYLVWGMSQGLCITQNKYGLQKINTSYNSLISHVF
jgi:hypothetical protein